MHQHLCIKASHLSVPPSASSRSRSIFLCLCATSKKLRRFFVFMYLPNLHVDCKTQRPAVLVLFHSYTQAPRRRLLILGLLVFHASTFVL